MVLNVLRFFFHILINQVHIVELRGQLLDSKKIILLQKEIYILFNWIRADRI